MSNRLSPCVQYCEIDDNSGLCKGCHRTVDEIMMWPRLAATTKKEIMYTLLPERRKELLKTTGSINSCT